MSLLYRALLYFSFFKIIANDFVTCVTSFIGLYDFIIALIL